MSAKPEDKYIEVDGLKPWIRERARLAAGASEPS